MPAGREFAAFALRQGDIGKVAVKLSLADDWPHLYALPERMADLQRLGLREEPLDESVVDRPMDDQPRGSRAFLSRPAESAVHGEFDGAIEIGVVHDHERIFR